MQAASQAAGTIYSMVLTRCLKPAHHVFPVYRHDMGVTAAL